MKKRVLNIFMIGVVASIILPIMVDASTFENGNKKYELKPMSFSCSLNSDAKLDGSIDKLNKMIFIDKNEDTTKDEEYYIVDKNNKCYEMTPQEILDYYNSSKYTYLLESNLDYNKYQDWYASGYISASGTTYSSTEQYYRKNEDDSMSIITDPTSADKLDDYYLFVYMSYPTKAVIDEDTTYYTLEGINFFNEVENPVVEDIYLYYYYDVKVQDSQPIFIETHKKITSPAMIDIFKSSDPYFYYSLSTEKDHYIIIEDYEDNIYIYDLDGNLMNIDIDPELDIASIKNIDSMIFVSYINSDTEKIEYKITDLDGEVLDSGDTIMFSENYFKLDDSELLIIVTDKKNNKIPYLLREYKLLTDDNLTYDNENMTFRFSGDHDDVATVKVNDVELDEKDYTITKGSTIVTLKRDYLNSLSVGDYVLKVTYNNSIELISNFKVNNINNPQTGDGIMNFIFIGGISLIGLLVTSLYLKKKRFN